MPTGNLPAEGKKLWEEVYQKAKKGSCKDSDDIEACASGSAWSAVKSAGWSKDAEGNWHKKAELQEFSLRIERAGLDKPTGDLLWRMVASDTDEDSYKDSMSLELFEDFIARAASGELVPEQFRSEFWSGGTPYLSISHYPDLNGDAVPGIVDAIYIDGNYFKAKGKYNKTKLGWACFDAVRSDLYDPKRQDADNKVRVSIAFLDWKHRHKSNDFVFTRNSMDDVCPECMKEMLEFLLDGKQSDGKEFLKGHLIHLAHTRVPVNKRTSMEVEKSMTTQKEDAASIVGEELANELEEKAKAITKSEALVIKSEEEKPKDEKEDKEEEEKEKVEKSDFVNVQPNPTIEDIASVSVSYQPDIEKIVKAVLAETQKSVEVPSHPLDTVFAEFKDSFDDVAKSDASLEDKLIKLQESYQKFADVVRASLTPAQPELSPESNTERAMTKMITVLEGLTQRMELVATRLSTPYPQAPTTTPAVPVQRSITPERIASLYPENPPQKKSLIRQLVERTT